MPSLAGRTSATTLDGTPASAKACVNFGAPVLGLVRQAGRTGFAASGQLIGQRAQLRAVPLERPRQADGSARTHFSITEA